MTKDKDEKAVIRARMARTGESYAAARAQLERETVPAEAPRTDGYMKLSGPAERALASSRDARATAWHVVLGLRTSEGLAAGVLKDLGVPVVDLDKEFGRPLPEPTGGAIALGKTYSQSWQMALGAAAALAAQENRPLVDSGVLLRAVIPQLGVIPSRWAAVAAAVSAADIASLCAKAERHGAEHPAKDAEGKETAGMFERFTDKARRVIVTAQEEARSLDHNFIGTEHLLLGLLLVGDGVGALVLTALGVASEATRREVEAIIGRGDEPSDSHIPFTPRAKKTLQQSLQAALEMNHNYIGTEHILLGLLASGEGVATHILLGHEGVTPESVRAKVIEVLEGYTKP